MINIHLILFSKGIYDEMGEYEIAQQCLARAKRLSPNVAKQCMISATIAEMHDKMVSCQLLSIVISYCHCHCLL
jgi:hypothetical protein